MGNEAPEAAGSEVMQSVVYDVCVDTETFHTNTAGGVSISLIIWGFVLQVCFLTWACLFSPPI